MLDSAVSLQADHTGIRTLACTPPGGAACVWPAAGLVGRTLPRAHRFLSRCYHASHQQPCFAARRNATQWTFSLCTCGLPRNYTTGVPSSLAPLPLPPAPTRLQAFHACISKSGVAAAPFSILTSGKWFSSITRSRPPPGMFCAGARGPLRAFSSHRTHLARIHHSRFERRIARLTRPFAQTKRVFQTPLRHVPYLPRRRSCTRTRCICCVAVLHLPDYSPRHSR